MKKFCVYNVTNLITGMTYKGQHGYVDSPIDGYFGSSPSLKEDIKKFGKENFKKDILVYNIGEDQIDLVEKAFIQGDLEKGNTYNKLIQGSGKKKTNPGASKYMTNRVVSSETKQKMSEIGKNRPKEEHSMYGKHHSEETRKKQSEAKKGVSSWNKGKECPQISQAKIGKHHYTNGVIEVVSDTCPEGFWRGGIPKKRFA